MEFTYKKQSKGIKKILVFDTETTDVPKLVGATWKERDIFDKMLLSTTDIEEREHAWAQVLETWPHILQLSYVVYEPYSKSKKTNCKFFNKYITVDKDVFISKESQSIHHISHDVIENLSANKKMNILKALRSFIKDVKTCDVVVAHNMNFDRKMIIASIRMLPHTKETETMLDIMMNSSKFVCTAEITTPILKMPLRIDYKDRYTGQSQFFIKIKTPKLIEAYNYYFGYFPNPDTLHNAIMDVVICLRVFCIAVLQLDIYNTNNELDKYIDFFSPKITNGYS
jgi:DNA polymerase III epsilon subunit-like protein